MYLPWSPFPLAVGPGFKPIWQGKSRILQVWTSWTHMKPSCPSWHCSNARRFLASMLCFCAGHPHSDCSDAKAYLAVQKYQPLSTNVFTHNEIASRKKIGCLKRRKALCKTRGSCQSTKEGYSYIRGVSWRESSRRSSPICMNWVIDDMDKNM